ncbi:MAG TPA: hypothetical protein RMH99_14755 [Sandaracinaceae bacterium LLY-WYZ-13_1]|nr:hypothetical protein [Sandaracinaceae bacterium LLY-WYZ-13_1]
MSLEAIDRSVATPAEPGDCPQLGLIGAGPSRTHLDVVLRGAGTELWTRILVEVRAVPYQLRIGDQVVPTGERVRYDGDGQCLGACPLLVFPEERLRSVPVVSDRDRRLEASGELIYRVE